MQAFRRMLIFAFLVLLFHPAPRAQDARQLAQKTFPSVVLIMTQDENGQTLSLGSGFFVRDGIIATNMHVVRGAITATVKLVGLPGTYPVNSLVAMDADADLVLLQVPGINTPVLRLSRGEDVAVGDIVYAIGNPEGFEGTFSQGIVSGIRQIGTDKLLQITAPISPGSSGGPVINGRGEAVGIAVATFSEGQNLNFAVPASYLLSLLGRVGEPRPLSAAKELQADSNSLGRMSGAKSTADAVAAVDFKWHGDYYEGDGFSFTFRSQLQVAVKDIHFYVVFLEGNKKHGFKPIDYLDGVTCADVVIPPNLAKYIETRANLDSSQSYGQKCIPLTAPHRVHWNTRREEVRVLDFSIVK